MSNSVFWENEKNIIIDDFAQIVVKIKQPLFGHPLGACLTQARLYPLWQKKTKTKTSEKLGSLAPTQEVL